MGIRRNPLGWLALAIGVVLAPILLPPPIATEVLVYAIVATAANLLIGFGGLFSFGQAAFFGIGGYVAGYMTAHVDLPLIVPLLASVVAGGAVAAIMGAICVRRSGIYFIMMTFAFNQMIYYIAYSWRSVTGGEDGLSGIVRPHSLVGIDTIDLDNNLVFYIVTAGLFLICFLLMHRVAGSPFGKILLATRDNPRRAASVGYDVPRVQTLAFAISGGFTGLAGALYGMIYWIMPIDAVHWLKSGYIVFMVLIGGTSSLFGPVIGAVIFILLQDFLSTVWNRWPLLFGLVIIAVVLYLRGGIIELFYRAEAAWRRRGRAGAKATLAAPASER